MNPTNKFALPFLGAFLAFGVALCGYFIGQTMYNGKVALNTAEAKGLAERIVSADIADWQIEFHVSGKSKSDIPNLYLAVEKNETEIIKLLKENGLSEKEINVGVIEYSKREFRDKNQALVDENHQLVGSIKVITKNVQALPRIRSKINKLMVQGINIVNHLPNYRFTKLNEIKPDMLREATKNARLSANEFAKNAGVKVGGIRSARQGNVYITDLGESYGDTSKIDKSVRIVTTITFYLTE